MPRGGRVSKLPILKPGDKGFGVMVFVSYVPGGRSYCIARCECGNERQLRTDGFLKRQVSCGCRLSALLSVSAIERQGSLGMSGGPEYRSWRSMRGRCLNPANKAYKRYGGRGISVCERWSKFANFWADMGKKPGPEYSIDRIDNDGNYEPGNCRWATVKQQNNNRSSNVVIKKDGQRFTVTQLAAVSGVSRDTALARKKRGYSDEEVFAPTSSIYKKDPNNKRWRKGRAQPRIESCGSR